jgi:hypothetical protein
MIPEIRSRICLCGLRVWQFARTERVLLAANDSPKPASFKVLQRRHSLPQAR